MKIMAALFLAICAFSAVPAAATESEERQAITDLAATEFAAENFSRLDAIEAELLDSKSRTSSGLWRLSLFYAGLDDSLEVGARSDETWAQMEHRVQRWTKAFPKSRAAHITYARALVDRGWVLRGGGFADTVPPAAWAPFRRYIERAEGELLASKSEASADPAWYADMLVIARAQYWDDKRFRRLLDEALAAEPDFYPTYFSALDYLLPEWHGNLARIESLADEATDKTKRIEGTAMYARIYWYASETRFGDDIFSNSLATWPKMRAGFDDIVQRYPDPWNVNNYARFACLARDRETTKRVMSLIGNSPLAEAWMSPDLFVRCRAWATGGSSAP